MCWFSAGSSKIQIRTSSWHKAILALLLAVCHDEVRIWIFDDSAENHWQLIQRPGSGFREGKLSNPRGHAARARCMKVFSKIYENPRARAARALCASFLLVKSVVCIAGSMHRGNARIPLGPAAGMAGSAHLEQRTKTIK